MEKLAAFIFKTVEEVLLFAVTGHYKEKWQDRWLEKGASESSNILQKIEGTGATQRDMKGHDRKFLSV